MRPRRHCDSAQWADDNDASLFLNYKLWARPEDALSAMLFNQVESDLSTGESAGDIDEGNVNHSLKAIRKMNL